MAVSEICRSRVHSVFVFVDGITSPLGGVAGDHIFIDH